MAEWKPEDDYIAERAYRLYKERGGEDGRALDDWLQAEAEVRQRELRDDAGEENAPVLEEGWNVPREGGAGGEAADKVFPDVPRDQELREE